MQRRDAIKSTQSRYESDIAKLLVLFEDEFPHKSHTWKKFTPRYADRDVFYFVVSERAHVWQLVAKTEQKAEEDEFAMPAVNDPSWAQLDIDSPVEVAWTNGRNGGNVYTAKIDSAEQVANGVVMPNLPGIPTFCAIAEFKPIYTSESTLVQMSLTITPYKFHLILPERSTAPQAQAKNPSPIAIPNTPARTSSAPLNRADVKAILDDVNAVLEQLAKKHDLEKLVCGSASFDRDGFTVKIEGLRVGGLSNEERLYDRYCVTIGLPPRGTKIRVQGSEYTIYGKVARGKKILIERNGKKFRVDQETVKYAPRVA